MRSSISLTYLFENCVDKVNRVHSVSNELKKEIVLDLLRRRRMKNHMQLLKTKKNFENISILKQKDGIRKNVKEYVRQSKNC